MHLCTGRPVRPPTKPAEHWKQKRTSQPGTLIKRPTRPAVWQLIKPDQSPAALGKAPQDPPLTTVQVALAPDMGGVVELLGGGSPPHNAGKQRSTSCYAHARARTARSSASATRRVAGLNRVPSSRISSSRNPGPTGPEARAPRPRVQSSQFCSKVQRSKPHRAIGVRSRCVSKFQDPKFQRPRP